MDVALDVTGFAYALGRAQGAWRFAGTELRRAAALATVSAAWDTFRRDAGVGEVGPVHATTGAPALLLLSDDPRRDAVLLWLADHGAPSIIDAAATLARMVGATRRFAAEEQGLLDAARDALAHPDATTKPVGGMISGGRLDDPVIEPLRAVAAAVDQMRGAAGFLEGEGVEMRLALPRGTLRRYVAPKPAGCWAVNLALLAKGSQPADVPPPPALVARASFRGDLEPEELARYLVENVNAAWRGAYDRLSRLEQELARGRDALAHLSRNARTPEAWLLVAALGVCTRTQIARALGLSRAGADIQARTLADAGLATLAAGGHIAWARPRSTKSAPEMLDQGPLRGAVLAVDADLAEIDRLLARTIR